MPQRVRCWGRGQTPGLDVVAEAQLCGQGSDPVTAAERGARESGRLDKRPASGSLGLLPSGPDPVGEGHVRRQPPAELSYETPPNSNPWVRLPPTAPHCV